ncbi:MAG: SH3 domain-containing protein [Hormoscilla sp. SP5CHS1]|nr:SH3 domain-containing protein [Hormoscilla sp. SP12CHS1]MBC6455188.1 SH3 domain-containing protein [Hormoscilla sp. SP5CHS1]
MILKALFYTTQLLLGLAIAIVLVLAGCLASARYFMTKMTALPPKPMFANDTPGGKKQDSGLPPGTYEARVTWPEGLILRDRPSYNSLRIGGIGYNERVLVLGESSDKVWQRVRVSDNFQEGWIKGGNTARTN